MNVKWSIRYAGSKSSNSIIVDEAEKLNPNGVIPITDIKGWYNKESFLEGLQISYGGKNSGPKKAVKDHVKTVPVQLILHHGERITHITGMCDDFIEQVTFHTNLGQNCQIGISTKGLPFELKVPEKVVGQIIFGYIQNVGICMI